MEHARQSSEYGTYKTVKTRLWPWHTPCAGESLQRLSSCPLLARQRSETLPFGCGYSVGRYGRQCRRVLPSTRTRLRTRERVLQDTHESSGNAGTSRSTRFSSVHTNRPRFGGEGRPLLRKVGPISYEATPSAFFSPTRLLYHHHPAVWRELCSQGTPLHSI